MNRACVVAIAITPALAIAEPAPAPAPEPEPASEAIREPLPEPASRPPTGRFVVGAGFSSDEGFIAHAALVQDDLFRTGQRLSLSADLSALRQQFLLAHEVPDLLGTGLDVRTELYNRRRAYPDVAHDRAGGAMTVGHRLDRATRIYARYRLEHVVIDPGGGYLDRTALAAPSGRLGDGMFASLGAGIAYETLDAPLLPTRGSRLELFAERADPRLGGDYRLVKVAARLDHATPLGPFTLRLAGRGAYVKSLEPDGVPRSERLQHDGHVDLAGYPLGTFASADLEATGRVELELPLIRSIGLSVAGFADAGVRYNADPAWGPTGTTLARAVGASIIWRSPIGPLRLDWAIPLDRADRTPVFLFGLGGSI